MGNWYKEMRMTDKKKYRPNLSEIVHDEIRSMILSGDLAQGARIRLEEMSAKLNLSVTPIREALNKLAQEDLILRTPRSHHEVLSLNAKDAEDLLELRLLLERFAVQTSGAYLARFPVQIFRDLFRESYASQSIKDFIEIDLKFHSCIVATSTNKHLGRLYSYFQSLIWVAIVPAVQIETRLEVARQEHLKILDAIERQDLDLVLKRLSSHLESAKVALRQHYSRVN